jgi:hypothetical protein
VTCAKCPMTAVFIALAKKVTGTSGTWVALAAREQLKLNVPTGLTVPRSPSSPVGPSHLKHPERPSSDSVRVLSDVWDQLQELPAIPEDLCFPAAPRYHINANWQL